ncbi:hypothetical protein JCM21900_006042 [Sporobolomyces salmonicolor]
MLALRSFALPRTACCSSERLCPKRRCLSSSPAPDPSPAAPAETIPRPPYRVLFFGADLFSCVTLKAIHDARADLIDHLVVITPPDQRTGRRLKEVHRPPLRLLAEELNLESIALPPTLLKDWEPPSPFLTPSSISSPSPQNLLLTASFGHLLPTALLSLFLPLNTLNVHPSLLPRYRGAAPIQWGIMEGDADKVEEEAMGVTVQELSRGRFDRGRILGQTRVSVPPHADFPTLEPILAKAGGDLLVSILRDLPSRQATAFPQDPTLATLAPKLTKASARIDWAAKPAIEVLRVQRGVGHQYALWTTLAGSPSPTQQLQLVLSPTAIIPLSSLPPGLSSPTPTLPGSLIFDSTSKKLLVVCGASAEEAVEVDKVKKEGGKWVDAREWWNGAKKRVGGTRAGAGAGLRFE